MSSSLNFSSPIGTVSIAMKQVMMSALLTWALMLAPQAKDSLAGRTIVIDPGHGGQDSGAIGNGVEEAPVVLSLSRTIARVLRSEGAKVVLTRRTNRYGPGERYGSGLGRRSLAARVKLARTEHADLFLSIHANTFPADSRIHGAQVFIGKSPDTHRIMLGTCLQERLDQASVTHWSVNRTQSLYLMDHLKIPAALVEVGFLSNPHEARLLVAPIYEARLATAIAQGLQSYYARRSSQLPTIHQTANAPLPHRSATRTIRGSPDLSVG